MEFTTKHRRSNSLPMPAPAQAPKVGPVHKKSHKRVNSLPVNLLEVVTESKKQKQQQQQTPKLKLKLKCSCIPCRRLHQRCEGMENGGPCNRCVKAGREDKCIIGEQRKRGPRKGWLERKNAQKKADEVLMQDDQSDFIAQFNDQIPISVPSSSSPSVSHYQNQQHQQVGALGGMPRVSSLPDFSAMQQMIETQDQQDNNNALLNQLLDSRRSSLSESSTSNMGGFTPGFGVVPGDLIRSVSCESLVDIKPLAHDVQPQQSQQQDQQQYEPVHSDDGPLLMNQTETCSAADINGFINDIMFEQSQQMLQQQRMELDQVLNAHNQLFSNPNPMFHCELPFIDFQPISMPMAAM